MLKFCVPHAQELVKSQGMRPTGVLGTDSCAGTPGDFGRMGHSFMSAHMVALLLGNERRTGKNNILRSDLLTARAHPVESQTNKSFPYARERVVHVDAAGDASYSPIMDGVLWFTYATIFKSGCHQWVEASG